MKIVRPVILNDSQLTSSNVPETDYSAWNIATPFLAGEHCIVVSTHKIYEALVNVTGGSSPEVDVLAAVPKWLDTGATNRWKTFDTKVGSQTSQATSITYKITPGQVFDSIAFLNLDAISVRVTLTDGVTVVYDKTKDLQTTVITGTTTAMDWYTYFFSSIVKILDFVFMDIPPYLNAVMDIIITYTGGTAKVGGIVFGLQTNIGTTRWSPSIGIHDYSVKEADVWGVYSVVQRAFSKRMSVDFWTPNSSVSEIQSLLALYRSTLLVWVASEDYAALIVYGFYKDFNIVIPYPTFSECSIDIEGMI